MTAYLNSNNPDFEQAFARLLAAKRETSVEVNDRVLEIIRDVQARGDEAVVEFTRSLDRFDVSAKTLQFTADEIDAYAAQVPDDIARSLQVAHDRIWAHHAKQRPEDHIYQDQIGVTLGTRWTPVDAVGLYVPGGLASYPSSVLMNAVPAKVAGVNRIAITVPTPDGEVNPAVLLAAKIAGVDEIYRVGGAQAIAALAYGTQTIPAVNKIVGPGNAYVAAAKKHVYGTVGIDMIAGPSEVIVIADKSANPAWVAADLLAQAEHGAGAQSVAIVTDASLADAVDAEVTRQLSTLRRGQIASEGWEEFGAIIIASDADEAVDISNRFAPEHLELAVDNPDALLPKVRHAGSIFLGHHTPEAIGDYVGGTNHVLPTARSARFSSGLGTLDFMKRSSILGLTPSALSELADPAVTLAECEDLQAHGRSVSIRLNR